MSQREAERVEGRGSYVAQRCGKCRGCLSFIYLSSPSPRSTVVPECCGHKTKWMEVILTAWFGPPPPRLSLCLHIVECVCRLVSLSLLRHYVSAPACLSATRRSQRRDLFKERKCRAAVKVSRGAHAGGGPQRPDPMLTFPRRRHFASAPIKRLR